MFGFQKEKDKKTVHLPFLRKAPIIAVTVLITLSAVLLLFTLHLISELSRQYSSITNALEAVTNSYEFFDCLDDRMTYFVYEDCIDNTRLAAEYVRQKGATAETLDKMKSRFEQSDFYIVQENTIILSNSEAETPDLTEADLELICAGEIYDKIEDGNIYYATACSTDETGTDPTKYLMLTWSPYRLEELNTRSPLEVDASENLMLLDISTGKVFESNDANQIGKIYKSVSSVITDDTLRLLAEVAKTSDSDEADMSSFGTTACNLQFGFLEVDGVGICFAGSVDSTLGYRLVDYRPILEIMITVISNSFVQLEIMILIACAMCFYSMHLCRSRMKLLSETDGLHLFGHWYLDKELFSHLTALLLFCMLLLLSLSAYIQLLTSYSDQNLTASDKLDQLKVNLQSNIEKYEALQSYANEIYVHRLQSAAWILEECPELVSTEGMKTLAECCGASEMSIYDANACSVASSDNYVGYYMSNNTEDPESQCRALLESSAKESVVALNDGSDNVYVTIIREDNPGLVRMTISTASIKALQDQLTEDVAILSTDFGSSQKAYIKQDTPNLLYWQNASGEIVTYSNSLTEEALEEGYSGVQSINGHRYYLSTLVYGDKIYFCAYPVSIIYSDAIHGLSVEFLFCILLYLVHILCTVFYRRNQLTQSKPLPDEGITEIEPVLRNRLEVLMDDTYRHTISVIAVLSGLFALLMLVLNYYWVDQSLLAFLFSTGWSKGFNLFSFTNILMVAIAAKIIDIVLRRLIILFSDNLGPHGMTIGHMLSGLIHAGLLIFELIFAAIQLGFNPGALLASMGISVAAFGLGAQNTINDLLSGLFIIFEGDFHVGDMITVGDWRGQVVEIGVRTTKLNYSGDIKIINNSNMKDIVKWSHTMAGALVFISVDYGEDVDKIIKLIRDNTARYHREIPHITEGVNVHGVTDLGDNGVTIRLWAAVDDENFRASVERDIRRVTKKMFDENGITIPFPQVVLHDGADRKEELAATEAASSEETPHRTPPSERLIERAAASRRRRTVKVYTKQKAQPVPPAGNEVKNAQTSDKT